MSDIARPDKGSVAINADECKGCGLCVISCALGVLRQSDSLNRFGYHPAVYAGHGCNGCGLCFYACPEPGAIAVYKRAAAPRATQPELVAA
ncbi:MAG: 4Fe-4S dicluster domain-containing protein [Acidobacteriia bacterium]|nr:4Fe-4S dicluster domain-containing protein [Terriglobia bacterium]